MATGRRRGRALIYLALILIMLLVLAFVLLRFNFLTPPAGNTPPVVANNNPTTPQVVPTQQDVVNIVVNTQDITRGQVLKDDLLATVAIPKADYTDGVFYTDKKEVVGARAKFDLKAHTPLTNALLVLANQSGSVPSFEIPAGKVAISIPIGKLSSVSYGLQKGDHVNMIVSLLLVDLDTNFQSELPNRTGSVIAPGPVGTNQTNVTALLNAAPNYQDGAASAASVMGRIEIDPTLNNPIWVVPSEQQRPRLVSQTLIQDAVVLQMGQFNQVSQTSTTGAAQPVQNPQPTQQEQQQATPTAQPTPVLPDVVTLIVEPQDAVTLNYLMLAGANINMVMRSAGDTQTKNTEAVTLQFVLDQYRIPNPAKLPYGMQPRIDSFDKSADVKGTPAVPQPTPAP